MKHNQTRESGVAIRAGLRKALQQLEASDFLTLVPNRHLSMRELQFYLWKTCRLMYEKVLRRSEFSGMRTDSLHSFVAVFERTRGGVPHVHMAARSAGQLRIAINVAYRESWQKFFPADDSFHVREFTATDIDYLLKDILRSEEQPGACTTGWLLLPPFCRVRRAPQLGIEQLHTE